MLPLALLLATLAQASAAPLTVSAAVSLTEALEEAAAAYRAAGGTPVVFNFGGSNTLARQIVNGAPVDVFISADEAQMEVVEKADLVAAGTRAAVVTNRLVLVVDSRSPVKAVTDLACGRGPPDRDRGSRGGASRRLCASVSRANRPVGAPGAEGRARGERAGGIDGGTEWQRRCGVRLRDRRPYRPRAASRGDHHRPARAPHRLSGRRGQDDASARGGGEIPRVPPDPAGPRPSSSGTDSCPSTDAR